nr:hypothetical protein [Amycolatopsis sp. DSM 110486]
MTATLTATGPNVGAPHEVSWGAPTFIEGLALEAEPHVGVDVGGYADVGVAEELLDHDEVDALFQEVGGGRVAFS